MPFNPTVAAHIKGDSSSEFKKIDTRLVSHEEALAFLVGTVQKIHAQVSALHPQPFLQPLSKPLQSEYGRRPNVAAMFRQEIDSENKTKGVGEEKYMQFPSDRSNEQLNRDMKRAIYHVMCMVLHPIPGLERMKWSTIREKHRALASKVIEQAAALPEFRVVSQGAGYFGIHEVADQRMQQRVVKVEADEGTEAAQGLDGRNKRRKTTKARKEGNTSKTASGLDIVGEAPESTVNHVQPIEYHSGIPIHSVQQSGAKLQPLNSSTIGKTQPQQTAESHEQLNHNENVTAPLDLRQLQSLLSNPAILAILGNKS